MKRKLTFALVISLIFVTLLSSCAPLATPTEATQAPTQAPTQVSSEETIPKEPIVIGVPSAFSGPIAYVGESYMMGYTLALEELGNEIAGYPIKLVTADNACNPDQAVTAVRKLVDVDNVDLILGSGCSSATLAVMPLLPEAEIAQITEGSTNPKIYDGSGVGGNIWQFRYVPDDRIMAEGFAPFIAAEVKSLSILAYNDDYGRGAAQSYQDILGGLGVEVVSTEYFERGGADFRPLLLNIKEDKPEGLLLVATESDGIVILRQLKELGLTQKLFARGAIVTPLFMEMTKKEPGLNEGIMEGTWWAPGLDPKFDVAFVNRWGTAPSPHRATSYFIMRYVVKAAIEEAAKTGTVDRKSIRDALEKISVETPVGVISFDAHHQAYPNMAVSTVENGTIKLLQVLETKAPTK
ncbi:MAG: ABC transporter substrate-binding protein [Anaerolineales bacterium]|nr:ABC transporter substrate-binding protein [Anaerolineales bacterium]